MTPDQDDDLLPKRKPTTKLEDESIASLTRVFPTDRYVIRVENVSDAGIDLTIESADSHFTNRRINVQMKSTEKGDFNQDGSISKSIERKNLIYLNRSPLLGLYIFYVKETFTLYYEWVHEFEEHLSQLHENWRSQETHTLRFEKLLDQSAVEAIFRRVEVHAASLQRLRAGLKMEQIIDSFHEPYNEKNYTDIEWSIMNLITIFDGLTVLPNHILIKLPPFSLTTKSQTHFETYTYHFTLYTDNQSLFDFFDSLVVENGIYRYKDNESPVNQESLKEILTFLEYNSIHHISPADRRRDNRVCIHKLFYHTGCECEKCSYPRLEWETMLSKLEADFDKSATYQWLRRGYMLLELGKTHEAFLLYKQLAEHSKAKGKHVAYFIAKFNLVSMLFLVRQHHKRVERDAMKKEIELIDLRNEINKLILVEDFKQEILVILLWLIESDYLHELYVEIDTKYQDILAAQFSDQRGGTVSDYHYLKIATFVSELTLFSDGNAFHSQYFNGFRTAIHKMIESALILTGLQNPLSRKPLEFDNYIVRLCFLYGDPEKINKLFFRYNVHPIVFKPRHDEEQVRALNHIDNLLYSMETAVLFAVEEEKKENYRPGELLKRQLHIAGIILSVMECSDADINRHALNFIRQLSKYENAQSGLLSGLNHIFQRKRGKIALEVYLECYKVLITSGEHDNFTLILDIPYFISEYYPNFFVWDEEIKTSIVERLTKSDKDHRDNYLVLLAYWHIADSELKDKITIYVNEYLDKSFHSRLYYDAASHSIIDYQKYLDKFIQTIPRSENAKEARRAMNGYDDFRNSTLDEFLHMAYKFGINLNEERIQNLAGDIDYYNWLLNLERFDYSKFNPYWILYQPIEGFLTEFKKYPKIIYAVREDLKKNPNPRLTEIYMKYFAG